MSGCPKRLLLVKLCLQFLRSFLCVDTVCVVTEYSSMGKQTAESVPRIKLSTGASIPAVGLGTWQSEPGLVGQAVKEAVKVRYCINLTWCDYFVNKFCCNNQVFIR
jgi:hypothetical protein